MFAFPWDRIKGSTVGQKYVFEKLVAVNGDQATFSGVLLGCGHRITISCLSAPEQRDEWPAYVLNLRHPRLRAVLGAGLAMFDGCLVRYIAMEPASALGSDCLAKEGPLATTPTRQLVRDLASGLNYLHDRNLVFCNLKPATIARAGQNWQLADFSLLRRAGSVDPVELRRVLTLSPQTPPDAFTGLISPAWDIYSLGVTLNQCMLGDEAMRGGRTTGLPSPFDLIVRGCLEPKPEDRISMQEIASLVGLDLGKSDRSLRAMAC